MRPPFGSAAPMTSRIDDSFCSRTYAARPSITRSGTSGSANVAVPTCTAEAPAIRNSSASSALVTPPALRGVDAHAKDGVDRGESVGAGLLDRPGDRNHVGGAR